MATSVIWTVIQFLRRADLLRDGAELTDGQLLEDYISRRDAAALEALVRRHGPMVWGVCRRVLTDHHDAEDAFQATFLVFVRRAASIASRELLANWLYGVAHRTAIRARANAARTKEREKQVGEMPEQPATEKAIWHDLQSLLDEELSRLPDKYRVVIVLSDLEGKTRKEVARHLGCPEGTVAGRLARARTILAKRLTKRGIAISAGSLAGVLSQQTALACLPPAAMTTTIKAVTLVAAGQAAATTAISARAAALTEGVLKTMLISKLKTVTSLLLLLIVVTFAGALLAWHQLGDKNDGVDAAKADNKSKPPPAEPPRNFANSIGMKFVWIPPGTFMMGSPKEEKGRRDNEAQHRVTLTKGFYMGVYPVTDGQWRAVPGNAGGYGPGKDFPITSVGWDECQDFIGKLREKDKKPYRLPTEAEWEYACRAGTTTPYHFGETITNEQANYRKTREAASVVIPVGKYPANAWGLHDMHGNIWQLCQDWLGEYPQNDVVDPKGPEAGLVIGIYFVENRRALHVLRGGSRGDDAASCRSASRNGADPRSVSLHVGFRLCFYVE
jgi:RNA polymerase sigma factor (sigma-70 family)